jgi:hypothetical protein
MWIVVEFRRGDIAQTWGIYASKNNAVNKLMHLMDMFADSSSSWWKILEVDVDIPMNRNTQYYVAIRMDWEDENDLEFIGVYDQMDMIPEHDRNDATVWIDTLVLDA